MQINTKLATFNTIELVTILRRLEKKSLAQRQREALIVVIREELIARATARAVEFCVESIHAKFGRIGA